MAKPKPGDQDVQLGLRIAALRKSKGASQRALAEVCGVTFQQVQKYESGANKIPPERLPHMATFLGVPLSELEADRPPKSGLPYHFLATTGAVELLTAYAAIPDPDMRKAAVNFMQAASVFMGKGRP